MGAIPFEEAIHALGYGPERLALEFSLSGANNNVLGLNDEGTPWAISVSFPKTREIPLEKLRSFERLQRICAHLTALFKEGVPLDGRNRFVFDGNCFLCGPGSVRKAIQLMKKKEGLTLPENFEEYTGPFLVKKGAPASETLEHSLDFRTIMLQGLSALHKRTGLAHLADRDAVTMLTRAVLEEIGRKAAQLPADDKYVEKFSRKWNPENDEEKERSIRREIIIRSDTAFNLLVKKHIQERGLSGDKHRCFIHGDAHGANFIVVQRGETAEVHPIDVEDALGVEEPEREHYLLDLVKFTISAYNLSRIFGQPLDIEEPIGTYYEHHAK